MAVIYVAFLLVCCVQWDKTLLAAGKEEWNVFTVIIWTLSLFTVVLNTLSGFIGFTVLLFNELWVIQTDGMPAG